MHDASIDFVTFFNGGISLLIVKMIQQGAREQKKHKGDFKVELTKHVLFVKQVRGNTINIDIKHEYLRLG